MPRKASRTQEARSAAARTALVRSAIEALSDGGIARATTAAIASGAGMTTGALHHHFPAKEDLFLAVLDELTVKALALIGNLGADAGRSKSLSRAIVDDLWSLYGSRQYWAVWEINMGYRGDEAMHRTLVAHRARTRERMRQSLRENEHLDPPTRRALLASLPFLLCALRGTFLETFFAPGERAALRPQLDALVTFLDARLRAGARRPAGKSVASRAGGRPHA